MRIDSLNVYLVSEAGKAKLAEEYAGLIDNLSKMLLSSFLKNQELSGDPTAGTVEANRMANTDSNEYGTARANRQGEAVKLKPVTIAIDIDREIINEVEDKDARLIGIPALIERKFNRSRGVMARELERAFFSTAVAAGTEITDGAEIIDRLDNVILSIETTKNEFVDGVERDMIAVVLSPTAYTAVRRHLDEKTGNANVDTAAENFGMRHGVRVYSSTYLPDEIEMVGMVIGSVAEPVMSELYEPKKIDLSNAWAFGVFFHYGVKAVMSDLIKYTSKTGNF